MRESPIMFAPAGAFDSRALKRPAKDAPQHFFGIARPSPFQFAVFGISPSHPRPGSFCSMPSLLCMQTDVPVLWGTFVPRLTAE